MTSKTPSIISVLTLTLWLTCLGVGVGGGFIPYVRPKPVIQDAPVQAEFIQVKLGRASPSEVSRARPAAERTFAEAAPPPMLEPMRLTTPAPFVDPVAQVPSPVKRVIVAPAEQAAATAVPQVTQLVYGQGEGAQPTPDYPREAALAGEEGVVGVRFTVDGDGNVQSADAVSPCKWPILNQAAVRSILDTWKFKAGAPRTFEINIIYQLTDN